MHRLSIVFSLGAALGCTPDQKPIPAYIHLASAFEPSVVRRARTEGSEWSLGSTIARADSLGQVWLETQLDRDAWEPFSLPRVWRTPRPLAGEGAPSDGSAPQQLRLGTQSLEYMPLEEALEDPGGLREGTFSARGDAIFVVSASPPGESGPSVLREYLDQGSYDGTRWRAALGPYSGDGFMLLPRERESVRCRYRSDSTLRFRTVLRGRARDSQDTSLRVTLNEMVLFDLSLNASPSGIAAYHEVALPDDVNEANISYELKGKDALLAVLTPTIGPTNVGIYASRPWGDDRPDIVIFLADTFRADNLAFYGGPAWLTPNLNALAKGSLKFERCWSTSTWTLPSHAALFSGLSPYQVGVRAQFDSLGSDATTIAERLRTAGYRTGAVTDEAFVSRRYGLAQGFDWFREDWGDFAETLEGVESFLAADDGRPVFLFVQSYRAHTPYEVTEGTRDRLKNKLVLTNTWDGLQDHIPPTNLADHPDYPELDETTRRSMRDYEHLYRGAAADLDECFARFMGDLEEHGVLETGYLVFTSDHGEAFWEHGVREHGNGLWEEHVRIPLFIHGSALSPGTVSNPTSLLDLAPTIAEMAGLSPDPTWAGDSILSGEPGSRSSVFAYECRPLGRQSKVAVMNERGKIISPGNADALDVEQGHLAYDLEQDPQELTALDSLPGWARDLLRESRAELRASMLQTTRPGRAAVTAESLQRLRDLGYLGK